MLLTIAVAFGASWWNSQISQNELKFKIELYEKRQEQIASQVADDSQAIQQNANRLIEVATLQQALAEQVRELHQEQEQLKVAVMSRR